MSERRPPVPLDRIPVMRVRTDRVVALGIVLWLVALVAVLLVPALHDEGREWWPWVCVAGVALGALGQLYVRTRDGRSRGA